MKNKTESKGTAFFYINKIFFNNNAHLCENQYIILLNFILLSIWQL